MDAIACFVARTTASAITRGNNALLLICAPSVYGCDGEKGIFEKYAIAR